MACFSMVLKCNLEPGNSDLIKFGRATVLPLSGVWGPQEGCGAEPRGVVIFNFVTVVEITPYHCQNNYNNI